MLRIIGYYEKNNRSAGGALQNRIIGQKKSTCLDTLSLDGVLIRSQINTCAMFHMITFVTAYRVNVARDTESTCRRAKCQKVWQLYIDHII